MDKFYSILQIRFTISIIGGYISEQQVHAETEMHQIVNIVALAPSNRLAYPPGMAMQVVKHDHTAAKVYTRRVSMAKGQGRHNLAQKAWTGDYHEFMTWIMLLVRTSREGWPMAMGGGDGCLWLRVTFERDDVVAI